MQSNLWGLEPWSADNRIQEEEDVVVNEVRVLSLFTYPIKSCAGIALDESTIASAGLRHDRSWMLVGEDGKFLNQQRHPRMALITLGSLDNQGMYAFAPEMSPLRITRREGVGAGESFRVYGGEVMGAATSPKANAWFTTFLGVPCRLIQSLAAQSRSVKPKHLTRHDEPATISTRVDFADDLPLLIATRESLARLNEELEHPVTIERFRPNIVLEGADAFAENRWERLRREDGFELLAAKPCVRCSMITVDPSRGELTGPEPLRTLNVLHNPDGGGPVFGALMMHRGEATLRRGDLFKVT